MSRPYSHLKKRSEIRAKIQKWADEHEGEPPRVKDWRRVNGTDWPSYLTVIRYFDSWDKAIESSGFKARGRGRPIE